MTRVLRAPTNPEVLGRMIAALRVYSGQRQPKNKGERDINDALKNQRIAPGLARDMVAAFDCTSKSSRARLLGRIAATDFVAPARATEPVVGPVTISFPAAAFIPGSEAAAALSGILVRDPDVTPLPLYTIRYQGLYCQKEMTFDQGSFSDEIYLITSAAHIGAGGGNVVRTERHPLSQTPNWYHDVDSGEERLGPVAAVWQGNGDPVSVTVVVVEHDQGDPNAYRDKVDAVVKAAIAILSKYYPPAAVLALLSSSITDGINWLLGTGDDEVDTETVVLPRALLEMYAGQRPGFYVGQKLQFVPGPGFGTIAYAPFSTHIMYHFTTVHKGGGATYVAGFDILREPPLDRPIVIL